MIDNPLKPATAVLPNNAAPPSNPYEALGYVEEKPTRSSAPIKSPKPDPYVALGYVEEKPVDAEADPYVALGYTEEKTIAPAPTLTPAPPQEGFREKYLGWLGYAPEQALSIVAHAVDFFPSMIRGTKETSRFFWVAAIGEEKTAAIEQLSYRNPVVGQLLKKGEALLDASGNFKNEADALLMQEALKQGGLPGVAAAALTNTILDTLMTLKTLKALGIGYGTQAGVKSTLGNAAIRATIMAVSAEGLSPKDKIASWALGFAYQATPALSGTIGKWFKSDWIAKVADVTSNVAITATFGKVVDEGYARAEAEGKPEMAGFYVMLNAIQKYGSDVVFGLMTKAFRASRNPAIVREIEKVAKAANVKVPTAFEIDTAAGKPPKVVLQPKPLVPPPPPTSEKAAIAAVPIRDTVQKEGVAGALPSRVEPATKPAAPAMPDQLIEDINRSIQIDSALKGLGYKPVTPTVTGVEIIAAKGHKAFMKALESGDTLKAQSIADITNKANDWLRQAQKRGEQLGAPVTGDLIVPSKPAAPTTQIIYKGISKEGLQAAIESGSLEPQYERFPTEDPSHYFTTDLKAGKEYSKTTATGGESGELLRIKSSTAKFEPDPEGEKGSIRTFEKIPIQDAEVFRDGKWVALIKPAAPAKALPSEPTSAPQVKSPFDEAPNMTTASTRAEKQADGTWKLLYLGTRNEVFPNEKFKSASEAKQYFNAEKERAKPAPAPPAPKPIIINGFHGRREQGSAIDFPKSELWISPSREMAQDRAGKKGAVSPIQTTLNQPLDLRSLGDKVAIKDLNAFLRKIGIDYQLREMPHQKGRIDAWEVLSREVEPEQSAMLFKVLRAQGYDGIVLSDNTAIASDNPSGLTYIQLRSAESAKMPELMTAFPARPKNALQFTRRPLSDYSPAMYRQMSQRELEQILSRDQGIEYKTLMVSNDPSLALSQAPNANVVVEFDSKGLTGTPNTDKPSWSMLYEQNLAEFFAREKRFDEPTKWIDHIKSITIRPLDVSDIPEEHRAIERHNRSIALSDNIRRLKGFTEQQNADGSVTFTKSTEAQIKPAPSPEAKTEATQTKEQTKFVIDKPTEDHFVVWLDKTIPDIDRQSIESGMRNYLAKHSDVITKQGWGWPTVRSVAEREGFIKPAITETQAKPEAKRAQVEQPVQQIPKFEPGMSIARKEEILGGNVKDRIKNAPSFQELVKAARSAEKAISLSHTVSAQFEEMVQNEPWDLLRSHAGIMNAKSARSQTLRALADKIIRETKLPMRPPGTMRGENYSVDWNKLRDQLVSKQEPPPEPPQGAAPTRSDFNAQFDAIKKTVNPDTGKRYTEPEVYTKLGDQHFEEGDTEGNRDLIGKLESLGAAKAGAKEFSGLIGIANKRVDMERERYGQPPAMERIRVSDPQAWNDAMLKIEKNLNAGQELVDLLVANPRPTTKPENALLLHQLVTVKLEHNKAATETWEADASGDTIRIRDANILYEKAVERHALINNVLDKTGTLGAQALQARKMLVSEDYDLAAMELHRKAVKGKPLTPEDRGTIKRIHEEYQEKIKWFEKEIARLEAEKKVEVDVAEKADADKVMKDLADQATAKDAAERKSGKEPDLEGDRARATERIQDAAESGEKPVMSDLQDPIQKLALYFEQKNIDANKGVSTLTHAELVASVRGVVKKIIPTVTPREIGVAISGYGTVRYPSKDAARVALSQHKSELQKVSALEAVQKNISLLTEKGAAAEPDIEGAKHTGFQRPAPGPIARDLTKQLQSALKEQDRLMKELGIQAGDPAERLKSALDAKKTRLKNQITDINRAIETRKELVRNQGLPAEDAETIALENTRDARMEAYREVFPDKPISDQERLDRAIQTAERSLEDWNQRVEDARQGIFPTKQKGKWLPDSERLRNLIGEREAVKKEVNWWHNLATPKLTPAEAALAAFKKRTASTMERIQEKIATRDFTKPVRTEIVLDKEAFEAKQALDKVKQEWKGILAEEAMKNRPWTQRVWDRTTDPFNEARRILSSFDLSFTLRQGGLLLTGHPIRAFKNLQAQLKAWSSPHEAYKANAEIQNRENSKNGYYAKAGLEFTTIEGGMSKGEEPFATKGTGLSEFIGRIPGIKASERAFTVGANKLRADSFDAMIKTMAKTGAPTDVELQALGRFLNIATGRGYMGTGRLAMATEFLSTVFWSPKLFISRFQLLAGAPFYHGSWRTRKLIAGEYARFLIGQGIIQAIAIAAGATVEWDPKSSDFGKLKFGNTHIDPMAGLSQATTFLARIATGETKTGRGRIEKLRGDKQAFGTGVTDVMTRFLRAKLSPLIGTMVNLAAGETVVGEPVTATTVTTQLFVPLSMNDILDSMLEQGVPRGTAISLLSILGWGVQTYDTRRRNDKSALDKLIWQIKFRERQKRLKSEAEGKKKKGGK